jgi:hypothetical protein
MMVSSRRQPSRRFLFYVWICMLFYFSKSKGTNCCHRSVPFLPQYLNRFRTLQKANKELQAALKLSGKRGRTQSDDEDLFLAIVIKLPVCRSLLPDPVVRTSFG